MPAPAAERERVLRTLGSVFDRLALLEETEALVPGFARLYRELQVARGAGDPEGVETALVRLYCITHGSGGAYAPEERRALDDSGGYWCHAGGIEPLAMAAPFIGPETRLADYGAGNGLQGLLLQLLHPHRLTTLIEIGGPMVEQGRRLQALLGVAAERTSWVHANVLDVPPRDFDVIYLYRPVRPEGPGGAFYEMFARELGRSRGPVTIFSVADCLRPLLPPAFRVLHDDGQLAIFTNRT
jgi:hypothetical protein